MAHTNRGDMVTYFRQIRGMSQQIPTGIVHSVQKGQEVRPNEIKVFTGAKNLSPFQAKDRRSMLPTPLPHHSCRNTIVLDLDETLVHSSFKPVSTYDTVLPIKIQCETYQVYVTVRPHVQAFLQECGKLFETIIFTASLSVYAERVMDYLDPGTPEQRNCPYRLFREHCSSTNGACVKDLSLLGRELHRTIIVDNSPVAYLYQPRNAIPVVSWFDDPRDSELHSLIPWLHRLAAASDVYPILDEYRALLTQK